MKLNNRLLPASARIMYQQGICQPSYADGHFSMADCPGDARHILIAGALDLGYLKSM